jgi:hypothetical protein
MTQPVTVVEMNPEVGNVRLMLISVVAEKLMS